MTARLALVVVAVVLSLPLLFGAAAAVADRLPVWAAAVLFVVALMLVARAVAR